MVLATLAACQSAAEAARPHQPRIVYTRDSADWSVVLPDRYQQALDKVAPGFRPFRAMNWGDASYAPTANGSSGAQIVDLNGDHAPDVALAGTVRDSLITVVLLYTASAAPGGIAAQVLTQGPWAPLPAPSSTLTSDSAYATGSDLATIRRMRDDERRQTLSWTRTPDGKSPRVAEILTTVQEHGTPYVRWQDGDCKDTGWQWRVQNGKVLRERSTCSYGE